MDLRASLFPPDQKSRIPALDGLRGLAVLLVLLEHAGGFGMRLSEIATMRRAGKYGVYLFFVLSAFLLTRLLILRPLVELLQMRIWWNYFLRRFLRIFPPYAIILLTLLALHRMNLGDVANHLLLRDGVQQFWTIPPEVKYYLLLPFLALTISAFSQKRSALGILAAVGLVVICFCLFRFEMVWSLRSRIRLAKMIAPFVMGSTIAVVYGLLETHSLKTKYLRPILEGFALLAFGAILLRIPFIHDVFLSNAVSDSNHDPVVVGALWSLVLLGMLHGTGLLQQAFMWLPLRYVGLVSYSAYLWHWEFLKPVAGLTAIPTQLRLLIYGVSVLAVASVSYLLVERPLSRVRLQGGTLRRNPLPAVTPKSQAG